jgi:hypothetical protein
MKDYNKKNNGSYDSVKYRKKMDKVIAIIRFLNGLNQEITNVMELQHYIELEDMIHMAMNAE